MTDYGLAVIRNQFLAELYMPVFKGIRYARAKRFGKPEQEPPLSSLEDIETVMKICPQNPGRLGKIIGRSGESLEQSEDCLRLAIHTPSTESSLPVLVWIHGGAYLTGSGLFDKYGATHCMELPLLFGNFEMWKDAPFMDGVSYEEYKYQSTLLRTELLKFIYE